MKRTIGVSMVAIFLVAGLFACVAGTDQKSKAKPMVQVAEPVKMSKKAEVAIKSISKKGR